MVWGSLVKVADDRAMVLLTFSPVTDPGPLYGHLVMERFLVHAPNTSPRQVGHREVFSSLLFIGDWRTMVFNGVHKVFVVFSSRHH